MAWRVMIEKNALHQVEPARPLRGEVQVDAAVLPQPVPHRRVGVGPVVVDHDVELPLRVGLRHELQEGQELLVAVPVEGPVGDPSGGHLQGGEQGGGAMAAVVVGRPLRKAGAKGQDRLGPLRACIWLFSSTHTTTAPSGGLRYNPTTSSIFHSRSGSVQNLKVSVRWGFNP